MAKVETTDDPSVLQDFSGGLNTLISPNRLPQTQTPSANNVWYDDGALTKKPGQLQTNTGTVIGRAFSGYSTHDSVFSGAEQMIIYGSAGVSKNFLCYSALGTDLNLCVTATTGTASCPASTAVTGVGTNWLTGGTYGVGTAAPGALFISSNVVGVIQSVNSDTSLTLTGVFGATISGASYNITNGWPSSYRVSFADMNQNCWISGWGGAPVAWDGSNLQFINPLPIGTIVTANNSTTVTGTGTKFSCISALAISQGFASISTPDGSTGTILSVQSDTSLTLAANYPTTNSGGVSYTLPNFPQMAYSLPFSNYIFAANSIAAPSLVQWSNLFQPQIWPPSNNQPVNPNDGFPIVGLFYDGQSNCILKNNSMWKLNGTAFNPASPTYTLTQVYVPSDFFINSPKSVQLFELAQGFLMLGKNGFYSYNGAGAVSKILKYDIVRSEFAQMNAFNTGNVPTVTAEPSSIIVNGSYWLQVPNALSAFSNVDKELTYVIDKTGAFWQWQSNANGVIADFCYFLGNLYGVNSYSGGTPGIIQLNQITTSDAQSTAISGTFTTKLIQFKNQHRFGLAYIYYKKQSAGNLTFSYAIDEGSYTSTTIDMTTGTGVRTKSAPILVGQVGYSIQFQVSNSTAAQNFEIYSIEFDHQELRQ